MKKTILLFSIILTLSLCSCVNSQTANTQSTTSNQQTTTDSVSEPTSVPATEQPKQKNKGTVSGKYDVEIVTAKTATDFQGNLTSVSANAFQNSIQCNVATMMPDVMDAQPSLAEVQPGGTITLECAYSLQDTANPITVQVGPLMSITNEVNAQMTFSFKNN